MNLLRNAVTCILFVLLSSCATVTPVAPDRPAKILTPTKDFTMRIPPFFKVEILKNLRVPVVGTTQRNGKTYRVVILPAATASQLRFLINDDGSFEGSAINAGGDRMGWSYEPSPSDVRLIAESAAPPPPTLALTPEQVEEVRSALDSHLAATLKDPASAIQYSVGEPTECRNVASAVPSMRDDWCVCYMVNAKNSMGGYTGAQLSVASLITRGPPYIFTDVPRELINQPRGCKNISPRESKNIHELVK